MNKEFLKALVIGSQGERATEKVFTGLWDNYSLYDVRHLQEYQQQDVDYVYSTHIEGIDELKIEVKTDTRIAETGNLYLETWDDVARGRIGWFNYTKADILTYYDYHNDILHIVKFCELQEVVAKVKPREVAMRETLNNGYYKEGRGLLLSVEHLALAPSYTRYAEVLSDKQREELPKWTNNALQECLA